MSASNLKQYVDEFFDNLTLYDDYKNHHDYKKLLKAGIDVFLKNENPYNAFEIYQTFLTIYQITPEDKSESSKSDTKTLTNEPNTILDLVQIMKKYEENTGDLIDKQRDHFVHSVNVFLLGLAIYSQNKTYRDTFKNYVLESPYKKYYRIDGKFSNEEFLYRWGIAALFHDIGYPVEIIGKQMKKFLNDGIKSISNAYEADTAIDFKDFDEFNTIIKLETDFTDKYRKQYPESKFLDLYKPTDIMANKIILDFPEIDGNELTKHLNNFVDIMGDGGFIDHGFFSAILILNSYGFLVQKYAKDYDFFFYPIVDSATAIVLHNYYRNVLMKKFGLKDMDPTKSPLSYLLILCDELQEWNRQPFGVLDRQKSRVNELEIDIDNNKLNLTYIVHSGSMGLGFSEDKENFLREVLNITSIFNNNLTITTVVEQDNVMREIVKAETQSPDILLRNVEKLALAIHNKQYIETVTNDYNKAKENDEMTPELQEKFDNLKEFDEIPPSFILSSVRQARSIPKKLSMIGCEIALKSDSRDAITEFTEDEIIDLAIEEHDEWCEERIGMGWKYGEKKDVDNLISPYIVPWDELTPEIQQYDIDAVKNIPSLVESIDLKIVRTKVRLLTFKMHEFYNKSSKAGDFDKLPEYIKYSNYKQADFLVKILGELKYDVVSKDSKGEVVEELDEDVLEYMGKREHEAWCKLRINLGWKYGKERNDELKINPNLVPWDELPDSHKTLNKTTFKNLPGLCDEVGLMIIKN
ncbi:MAG: hypothetical protein IJJ47_07975 [Methanosphaera sp.]|nr:hypothetical protein [Methanosphaera sp.]